MKLMSSYITAFLISRQQPSEFEPHASEVQSNFYPINFPVGLWPIIVVTGNGN